MDNVLFSAEIKDKVIKVPGHIFAGRLELLDSANSYFLVRKFSGQKWNGESNVTSPAMYMVWKQTGDKMRVVYSINSGKKWRIALRKCRTRFEDWS